MDTRGVDSGTVAGTATNEARALPRSVATALALLVAGVGGAAALAWTNASRGPAAASAPPRWLVADRDANELVALDENFLVTARVAIELPIELAPAGEGRVWVACATAAGPAGPHVLRRATLAGTVERELAIGALFDLDTLGDGSALYVAGLSGGEREATLVRDDGTSRVLATGAGLLSICGRRGKVLVGTEQGALSLFEPDRSRSATVQRSVGGSIADVAPGPSDDTWWVLDASGGPTAQRLMLLEADLTSRWQRSIGMSALHLAPVRGHERVWLADATGDFACRFGAQGVLEIAYAPLALTGCDRGVAAADGSVVFAAPGALVALDGSGAPLPGQGGFEFLVDLTARGE